MSQNLINNTYKFVINENLNRTCEEPISVIKIKTKSDDPIFPFNIGINNSIVC